MIVIVYSICLMSYLTSGSVIEIMLTFMKLNVNYISNLIVYFLQLSDSGRLFFLSTVFEDTRERRDCHLREHRLLCTGSE